MTTVNIILTVPVAEGTVPAVGKVEFHPTARYEYAGEVVLPAPFMVELDENGEAVVELDPTDIYFAWRVREFMHGGDNYYVVVPDSETPVNLQDLERVDPETLEPIEQFAAWSDIDARMDVIEETVANISPLTINSEAPVDGNFNISATDVGAVPSTGGTFTGDITINTNLTVNGALQGHKVIFVTNQTGALINKGKAVYISGASGHNAKISLAIASGEATSSKTLGIVYSDIPSGGSGLVLTEGYLEGINTNGAVAGDPIWLSPTVLGGLAFGLANKPQAPNHVVYLGTVARVNVNNGRIFVQVANGWELDELHNVRIENPQHGDILTYDSISQLWRNVQP